MPTNFFLDKTSVTYTILLMKESYKSHQRDNSLLSPADILSAELRENCYEVGRALKKSWMNSS